MKIISICSKDMCHQMNLSIIRMFQNTQGSMISHGIHFTDKVSRAPRENHSLNLFISQWLGLIHKGRLALTEGGGLENPREFSFLMRYSFVLDLGGGGSKNNPDSCRKSFMDGTLVATILLKRLKFLKRWVMIF